MYLDAYSEEEAQNFIRSKMIEVDPMETHTYAWQVEAVDKVETP